jgi:hypothetical protein
MHSYIKCNSTDNSQGMETIYVTYIMEYLPLTEKEILPFGTTGLNLEDSMVHEIRQT